MSVLVKATTDSGGAVSFVGPGSAWASYAVSRVGGKPAPEILYAGATLPDGRPVQFFLNRETGLIVVDVIDRDGNGGKELLRVKLTEGGRNRT